MKAKPGQPTSPSPHWDQIWELQYLKSVAVSFPAIYEYIRILGFLRQECRLSRVTEATNLKRRIFCVLLARLSLTGLGKATALVHMNSFQL